MCRWRRRAAQEARRIGDLRSKRVRRGVGVVATGVVATAVGSEVIANNDTTRVEEVPLSLSNAGSLQHSVGVKVGVSVAFVAAAITRIAATLARLRVSKSGSNSVRTLSRAGRKQQQQTGRIAPLLRTPCRLNHRNDKRQTAIAQELQQQQQQQQQQAREMDDKNKDEVEEEEACVGVDEEEEEEEAQFHTAFSAGETLEKFVRAFFAKAQLRNLPEWRHSLAQTASILALYHAEQLQSATRNAATAPIAAHDEENHHHHQQQQQQQGLAELLLHGEDVVVDRTKRIEAAREYARQRSELASARHYMRFASAAYGAVFLAASGLLPSDAQLPAAALDNETAVLAKTNVRKEDLVRLEIGPFSKLGVFCPAHFVAVEHATRAVVITIRGTLSIDDIITDLVADDSPFPPSNNTVRSWLTVDDRPTTSTTSAAAAKAENDRNDDAAAAASNEEKPRSSSSSSSSSVWGRVHSGVARSAVVLFERKLRLYVSDLLSDFPDYDVVLTGHSLGAGVAIALAILMMESVPEIEAKAQAGKLKCYAFAPPHTFAPRSDLAEEKRALLEKVVCCVVCHSDVVPRLSARSVFRAIKALEALDLDETLSDAQRDAIITSRSIRAGTAAVQDAMTRLDANLKRASAVKQALSEAEQTAEHYAPLTLPGKSVFWLFNAPSEHTAAAAAAGGVTPAVLSVDPAANPITMRGVQASVFDELVLTDGCFRSHFPDAYERALAQVAPPQPLEFDHDRANQHD